MQNEHSKSEKLLVALFVKHKGVWDKIYESIAKKEYVSVEEAETAYEQIPHNFITLLDERYPEELKRAPKPPFILFYQGDLDFLSTKKKRALLIDNTSDDSDIERSVKSLKYLISNLNINLVLVQDISTQSFVNNFKQDKVIVVRSTQDFNLYQGQKLLLAETCYGQEYLTNTDANRIAVALCDYSIVSGTTVEMTYSIDWCLCMNKEIYVIPTDVFSHLRNNDLISSQKAKILVSRDDLLEGEEERE